MARERISSSDRFWRYMKLNHIAFAATLFYVGYVFGCMNNDERISLLIRGGQRDDANLSDDERKAESVQVESLVNAPARFEKPPVEQIEIKKDVDSPAIEIMPNKLAYANGPVVYNDNRRTTSINLLGERHSGTNWITDHLQECFGDQIPIQSNFTRFKHWFQFDDIHIRNDSAVVIAMFRDPYDWVEAMRERPHHAHQHIGMQWKDFVTTPWVGPRRAADIIKMEQAKAEGVHMEKAGCLAGYTFDEVIPCSTEDSIELDGYSSYMYELRHDKSHRAYDSIIDLRSEKIRNFMQVPQLHGVKAFFPERYEALYMRGTAYFIKQLEEVTGLKANCTPFVGKGVVAHKRVDPAYMEWMNNYHDWEAEALIGYVPRTPIDQEDVPLTPEQLDLTLSSRQSNAQFK